MPEVRSRADFSHWRRRSCSIFRLMDVLAHTYLLEIQTYVLVLSVRMSFCSSEHWPEPAIIIGTLHIYVYLPSDGTFDILQMCLYFLKVSYIFSNASCYTLVCFITVIDPSLNVSNTFVFFINLVRPFEWRAPHGESHR